MNYNKIHLNFESLPFLSNPWKKLDLKGVALGLINLTANKGYTFTHKHKEQEEVYIVIAGKGQILIEDEIVPIENGDIVRVSPAARRSLKASTDGLFIICAGGVPAGYPKNPNSRYMIDDGIPNYDDIPPWYEGDEKIMERNQKLKKKLIDK